MNACAYYSVSSLLLSQQGTWWCVKEASMSVRGYLHSCTHATHIYTLNIYIGRVCLFHTCNTHTRTRTQNCDYLEFLHRRAIVYTILKSQKIKIGRTKRYKNCCKRECVCVSGEEEYKPMERPVLVPLSFFAKCEVWSLLPPEIFHSFADLI